MNLRILLMTLLVALAIVAGDADADARTYYKWTDDQGTVHFTAEPPMDRDYEEISMSGQRLGNRSAEPAAAQDPESGAEAEPQMPREAELTPEEQAHNAAVCEQARQNLTVLQTKSRILVEDADGTQRAATEEERQRLIDEARTLIAQRCSDGG